MRRLLLLCSLLLLLLLLRRLLLLRLLLLLRNSSPTGLLHHPPGYVLEPSLKGLQIEVRLLRGQLKFVRDRSRRTDRLVIIRFLIVCRQRAVRCRGESALRGENL